MSRRFTVNAPAVVSEVIDGEAVILNLRSGHYFSALHTGAVVWEWIDGGAEYQPHWSLVPPKQSAVPAVRTAELDGVTASAAMLSA